MNAVITSYFVGAVDPQRGVAWTPNESDIYPLAHSCERRGIQLIVLNDCFEPGERNGCLFVTVVGGRNPYFQRWEAYRDYLANHEEIESAFLVDATDVIMQFDPFYELSSDKLYVGDEFEVLGCDWVRQDCAIPGVRSFINSQPDVLLLNAGVLGGGRRYLELVASRIIDIEDSAPEPSITDMAVFNFVLRTHYNRMITRGRQVTTIFKGYEDNSGAWFKHK
jgi:hypothetical protein